MRAGAVWVVGLLLVLIAGFQALYDVTTHKSPSPAGPSPSIEPRSKDAFLQFRALVNKHDAAHELIADIQLKENDDLIIVRVTNAWVAMPYRSRLQNLNLFWRLWSNLLDRAYENPKMEIIDLTGLTVGGADKLRGAWTVEK